MSKCILVIRPSYFQPNSLLKIDLSCKFSTDFESDIRLGDSQAKKSQKIDFTFFKKSIFPKFSKITKINFDPMFSILFLTLISNLISFLMTFLKNRKNRKIIFWQILYRRETHYVNFSVTKVRGWKMHQIHCVRCAG